MRLEKTTAKKSATNVKQIVWHFNLFAKHVQEHQNGSEVKKRFFIILEWISLKLTSGEWGWHLSIAKVQSVGSDFMTMRQEGKK